MSIVVKVESGAIINVYLPPAEIPAETITRARSVLGKLRAIHEAVTASQQEDTHG